MKGYEERRLWCSDYVYSPHLQTGLRREGKECALTQQGIGGRGGRCLPVDMLDLWYALQRPRISVRPAKYFRLVSSPGFRELTLRTKCFAF